MAHPPQWNSQPPPTRSYLELIKKNKKAAGFGAGGVLLLIRVAAVADPAPTSTVPVAQASPPPSSAPAAPAPATSAPAAPAPATSAPAAPVPAASMSATPAPPAPAAPAAASPDAAELPNFVGMGLQSAQDKAPATGFSYLTSHDALGRSRLQIDDRNWKVCTQSPVAGRQSASAKVDFGTVQLDEQCPAADQGVQMPKAGATMPDFSGKAMSTARQALDRSTSFVVKDVLEKRMVLVESNWQVCTQDPKPGTALNGQPVTFGVVKFEEKCP
ncbi:hypothetical protein ACIRBX_28045 [Kitasatospora sp. NPDC096147]|uniref:Stk1 family PASTA domain-containing Ser/Thr kinase n=1 Tax=Kitasatospora sp. NPDC096147 TaxID=3364093 RepID=UPI0038198D53